MFIPPPTESPTRQQSGGNNLKSDMVTILPEQATANISYTPTDELLDETELNPGDQDDLFSCIDTNKIWCLNELSNGMGKSVIKPNSLRLDVTKKLTSPSDDSQLILFIPFTSQVKVKSFCVISSGSTAPSIVKMWFLVITFRYTNREDIDFSNVNDIPATQEFNLVEGGDHDGSIYYPTKLQKFQNISSLVLFFNNRDGTDQTEITYIGFKGEFTKNKREIVEFVYEARANPVDHQTKDNTKQFDDIS